MIFHSAFIDLCQLRNNPAQVMNSVFRSLRKIEVIESQVNFFSVTDQIFERAALTRHSLNKEAYR
jgi:hypothetical protein